MDLKRLRVGAPVDLGSKLKGLNVEKLQVERIELYVMKGKEIINGNGRLRTADHLSSFT